MGIIRGGLLVIVSVLFFVSILFVNSFLTISSSLDYENVQEELIPIVVESLNEEINFQKIIEEKLPILKIYCENNSEFVFQEQEVTFDISCESVGQGTEVIINEAITEFVEKIYYEEYDCNFINCFEEQREKPFFLVSEKTRNYFQNKFYLFLFISLIFLGPMFFLIENKTNLPIIVGSLLIISSLPFLKLQGVISLFADKSFLQFFTFLFTKAYFVFLITFILGIIILAAGIILKFFKIGFKVSNLIDKFKGQKTGEQKPVKNITSKNSGSK